MKNIGIIGLGNMGMGMAKNLLTAGYHVYGFNRSKEKLETFSRLGGQATENCAMVGKHADLVFIMVVNEEQVFDVVFGENGLIESMKPGSILVVSATINSSAVRRIEERIKTTGICLIDSPVSGGKKGADAGELTLMVSGDRNTYYKVQEVFQTIGKNIFYVGEQPGMGQITKACLQGLVGCIYTGIFESLVLGVKAGVSAETLYSVIGASVANNPLFQGTVPAILDRKFEGTGSNIGNTYKDLSITMDLAEECGVPMMTTSVAKQIFQAGMTKFPKNDNQGLIKLLEDIVGIEVKR
ncbi:NAD(P)-dependent oxidoreductase [Bacillus timonensis]|uniref:NAD(P)-dependent oxidoreductase n=1 Tax=Bacillus timonensis TaxID=1033734 RepID=A0A4S3PP75_9BACI|nr:NAD(P)-dependent oxidoreductase [Bacillus timonensis]THE10502.1 NAD(P)-dependent oxidoreductase [Bacillus timonensis]